ncbi:hypothetical protein HC776_03275 [bacterium]|nr:hypothetical protein [bacterium]
MARYTAPYLDRLHVSVYKVYACTGLDYLETKLLERLEAKKHVKRNRNDWPHSFQATVERAELISRRLQTHANIIVDAGGYKANRANRIKQLATRMADQAVSEDRTVVLEPMPPHERRIVHLTLRLRDDVTTKSIGEGDNRKVTISRKVGDG